MARVRKYDLSNLSPEQAEAAGFEVGVKIDKINAAALAKINKLIKKHGLEAKMAVQFVPLETSPGE